MNSFLFLVFLTSSLIYCGVCKPQNPLNTTPSESIRATLPLPQQSVQQENPDPEPEPDLEEPNQTEISFMDVPFSRIDKFLSDKIREISIKTISSEIGRVKQEVERNSIDLRGQITALHDHGSREMNMNLSSLREELDKLTRQVSLLKDAMTAPPPVTDPPSVVPPSTSFSNPRFYQNDSYEGVWFQPSPDWDKICVVLPDYMSGKTKSITLGGHCLLVCPDQNCGWWSGTKSRCLELHSNSVGLDSLAKVQYNDKIWSFRLCQTTVFSNPY